MGKFTKEKIFNMQATQVYKMVLKGNVIKKFPDGFWQRPEAKENAKECVVFMVENILKWDEEDIRKNLTKKTFQENKLSGMMNTLYNNSPYEAINDVYPNKFMPWELNNTPMKYWEDKSNCKKATEWMLDKLNWSDEDIKKNLSTEVFKKNGLDGMLTAAYKGSFHSLMNDVYPNKFMPWEFKVAPKNYWKDKDNCKKAMKWMLDKLNWSDEDIKKNLSQKTFVENNLLGMLFYRYNGSVHKAINDVYPNKFKPWEYKNAPKNYWKDKNNCIKATKWLICKMKYSNEDIEKKLTRKVFKENGLNGMLRSGYEGSVRKLVEDLKMDIIK